MATKYISGEKREILCAVDSAVVINAGDLVYLNTDDVRSFSALSDSGTKAQNQAAAHNVFLGVARHSSQSGQTRPILVATAGIWEFDCTSATYEIGGHVGPEGTGSAGAVGVSDTTVVTVANSILSIGKVAKRGTTVTRLRVSIQSTILNSMTLTGSITADDITLTTVTASGEVNVASDAVILSTDGVATGAITEGSANVGLTIDGLRVKDGIIYFAQGAPTAETTTTPTYAAAELLSGIITQTQTAAVTATLDTGTAMDTALATSTAADKGFFWSVINIGSASGALTVQGAAGHTLIGSGAVAISTSGRFFSRRTATNTWITYRVA